MKIFYVEFKNDSQMFRTFFVVKLFLKIWNGFGNLIVQIDGTTSYFTILAIN